MSHTHTHTHRPPFFAAVFGLVFSVLIVFHPCVTMTPKGKAKAKALSAASKLAMEKEARRLSSQAVRENLAFKGFSAQQIHGTCINGLSLAEKVYKDKLASMMKAPGVPSFGSSYYRALASEYLCASGGRSEVVQVRPSEALACREGLVDGLVAWGRSRDPVYGLRGTGAWCHK